MSNSLVVSNLQKLLYVNTPIVFIQDFDYARVDQIIKDAVGKAKVLEWNPACGIVDFFTKGNDSDFIPLVDFLEERYKDNCRIERYLVLKDIRYHIENEPRVRSLLQMISQRRLYDTIYNTSIIIVSPSYYVPDDISMYVSFLDIPFPSEKEIDNAINHHIEINGCKYYSDSSKKEIKKYLTGMSLYDIDRVLDMALSRNCTLEHEDAEEILKHKKQIVKRSGTVEIVDANESLEDIGGLDYLKKYLCRKAMVFKESSAVDYGVHKPKGVFLVGMPGCGKSLCAKAAGKIFNAPILKLDMGSLMGKYVGESEENMRKAIKIAEAAAPCILWIDEIEKAFSGVNGNGDNTVLIRMFGYFLTWMQDKTSDVYVFATANKAKDLPPELMRKGRFDEIFCIELPNEEERKSIFKAHLSKLSGKPCLKDFKSINLDELAKITKGFNGADIESAIYQAVEDTFLENLNRVSENPLEINESILKRSCQNTISISKSCEEQITEMEKLFSKSTFRNACTGTIISPDAPKPEKDVAESS